MPAVIELEVPLNGGPASTLVRLRIALLPQRTQMDVLPPLLDERSTGDVDVAVSPIQLLEGQEYVYEWEGLPYTEQPVYTDPAEVFQADTTNGRRGRLRPGLRTGTLPVVLLQAGAPLGRVELEVRSRKLKYVSEYRWMLRDIADRMTELLMDRFAASETSFEQHETRDAATLYQRFAFLRALIESDSFQVALNEVIRRPHVAWVERHEMVRAGASLKADSYGMRQLSRPGARVSWPGGMIDSLPVRLDRRHTEATHDTTPNRFVKFALGRWREVLADIDTGLALDDSDPAVRRGRREVAQVMEQLDQLLHHDLFRGLGPLARFPAENQVLQRREGYRDVFRAYVEFELAARLSWPKSESRFGAGQRDVATLYEYWAFIQLTGLVAGLLGKSFDITPLIALRPDGLNVVLQMGNATLLRGTVERLGRKMEVELSFNRTFSPEKAEFSSWTRPMRPDFSLVIRSPIDQPAAFEPVVLHFDAKYRVSLFTELFGGVGELLDAEDPNSLGPGIKRVAYLRADLLKMHAYRDAIRRSAGAYVLYPGDEDQWKQEPFSEYHELLPGLGAFVLRPTSSGMANGTDALRQFLDHVLDHLAISISQHERARYWLDAIYGDHREPAGGLDPYDDVGPPPETSFLIGKVESAAQWNWTVSYKTYCVATQKTESDRSAITQLLYNQLLMLYCLENAQIAVVRIVSDPVRVEWRPLLEARYPGPIDDYLCVQWNWLPRRQWMDGLIAKQLDDYLKPRNVEGTALTQASWACLHEIWDGGTPSQETKKCQSSSPG